MASEREDATAQVAVSSHFKRGGSEVTLEFFPGDLESEGHYLITAGCKTGVFHTLSEVKIWLRGRADEWVDDVARTSPERMLNEVPGAVLKGLPRRGRTPIGGHDEPDGV